MTIDYPASRQLPQLRQLWQLVFGDTDLFLDSFYSTAFSPDRCRCVLVEGSVAAALYWIDCSLHGRSLAYIYAVATHPDHRGKGLCRMLMEDTQRLLRQRGYAGAVLVPENEGLRTMYRKMGYENAGSLSEFSCTAAGDPTPLTAIGPAEFAARRRLLLPEDAVVQEGAGLKFLSEYLQFYVGGDFLLAGYVNDGIFHAAELLGDAKAAPGILTALGCRQGTFRIPGNERPFAMFLPLAENIMPPRYFGFAFD